ncbi:MAG: hypothetical protein AAB343_01835 [Patescibacteria group bacterium]
MKRQIVGIVLLLALVVGGVLLLMRFITTYGTCTDNRKNQDEVRIDCGGTKCGPCLDEHIQQPVTLWTRFFEVYARTYDVVASIRNGNQIAGGKLAYTIRLVNRDGRVVGIRSGTIMLRPTSESIIFEPNIQIDDAEVTRAEVLIGDIQWVKVDSFLIPVNFSSYQYSEDPTPRLSAVVTNQEVRPLPGFRVVALLEDNAGNVFAASETYVDGIAGSGTETILFTWPQLPARPTRPVFKAFPSE